MSRVICSEVEVGAEESEVLEGEEREKRVRTKF